MVRKPAAGKKSARSHNEPLKAGPSSRPSPGARRRTASPEKTVRVESVFQRPSGKTSNTRQKSSNATNKNRSAVPPGPNKTSSTSAKSRRVLSSRNRKTPFGRPGRFSDFSPEVDAQFDNDIKQAKRIESTRPTGVGVPSGDFDSPIMHSDKSEDIDMDVCMGFTGLLRTIQTFAQKMPLLHGVDSVQQEKEYLDHILRSSDNAQLVRYIGFIAMAGPKGESSWAELLCDDISRRALLVGIICHALREHVFDALWFGASAEQEQMLQSLETEGLSQDGFFRTRKRAAKIAEFEEPDVDTNLKHAEMKLTLQLDALINPLWEGTDDMPRAQTRLHVRQDLYDIVRAAAALSRTMREVGEVIYYFAPTFKDELFEPRRMECLNLVDVIRESPYDKQTIGGMQRAMLRDGQVAKQDALVHIVCCPGIEAYRQGGGNLARAEIAEEKRSQQRAPPDVQQHWRVTKQGADTLTGNEGFRCKIICKSVVLLRWGRQRSLTKVAGTAAHIKAVRDGRVDDHGEGHKGSVEFYDLGLERWTSGKRDPRVQFVAVTTAGTNTRRSLMNDGTVPGTRE